MTCKCSLSQAVAAMAAVPVGADLHVPIQGVSTDSRNLQAGELFLALTGENFDGHKFVEPAIARGAAAAVVSRARIEEWETLNLPLLVVPDTLKAYQDLAMWWREQCNLPVIAVTGSAGKTTTKEMIAALLNCYVQPGKQVHKSQANYNNDIGVAKTLLEIDPDRHDFAVVEMGMRGSGEIARLSRVARPNIGVITNIGTAHIGRLGSREAIAAAKCELLAAMPSDRIAVLNAEDELLKVAANKVWQGRTIAYGLGVGDIRGELTSEAERWEIEVRINSSSDPHPLSFQLPLPGRHNALNFLAAIAVVRALNLDWQAIERGVEKLALPDGRAQVHHLPGYVTILDETYNASPEAVAAALRLLADTPARRRLAILGTMKELGDMSASLHRQVGKMVRELGIDRLLVLSDGEADEILEGAKEEGNRIIDRKGRDSLLAIRCESSTAILQKLMDMVEPGDRLLFKASRSVGMDRIVSDFQNAWQEARGKG